jgi:hypothetical protein
MNREDLAEVRLVVNFAIDKAVARYELGVKAAVDAVGDGEPKDAATRIAVGVAAAIREQVVAFARELQNALLETTR